MSNEQNSGAVEFKVGGVYECRSACDSNCRWTFTVVRRSEGSSRTWVWVREGEAGEVKRRKVELWRGVESIFPMGKYSMAPVLRAENPVAVPV